jgi:hypothetical protein
LISIIKKIKIYKKKVLSFLFWKEVLLMNWVCEREKRREIKGCLFGPQSLLLFCGKGG